MPKIGGDEIISEIEGRAIAICQSKVNIVMNEYQILAICGARLKR